MLTDGDVSLSQRINSSLNDSSTKQAYSFGKAIRFKPNLKKDSFYKFYNLPEIRSHRGTSLGYGKKATSSLVGCGSNQLYAAPSYFDQAIKEIQALGLYMMLLINLEKESLGSFLELQD